MKTLKDILKKFERHNHWQGWVDGQAKDEIKQFLRQELGELVESLRMGNDGTVTVDLPPEIKREDKGGFIWGYLTAVYKTDKNIDKITGSKKEE